MPTGVAYTEEQTQTALMALIAWAGNAAAASRYLKSDKGIEINPATLSNWKQTHAIRYDELREKYSAQLEESLAHEFREVAMQAVQLERLAMERATEALEKNQDKDPSRSAANAARVAQSSTDKLLSLTGRPTQITESRNIGEILRSLAAKGILQIPEETGDDRG
jgi:uncharacterized protein YeaC (DUF1315 family)